MRQPTRNTRPPNGAGDLTTALANNITAMFRQHRNLDIRRSNLGTLLPVSPASHFYNVRSIRVATATLATWARRLERLIMAKEELMQFKGLVIEALPDARFRVQLDVGHEIVAYTAAE